MFWLVYLYSLLVYIEHNRDESPKVHTETHKEGYEDSVEGDLLVGTKRNNETPSEHWNF